MWVEHTNSSLGDKIAMHPYTRRTRPTRAILRTPKTPEIDRTGHTSHQKKSEHQRSTESKDIFRWNEQWFSKFRQKYLKISEKSQNLKKIQSKIYQMIFWSVSEVSRSQNRSGIVRTSFCDDFWNFVFKIFRFSNIFRFCVWFFISFSDFFLDFRNWVAELNHFWIFWKLLFCLEIFFKSIFGLCAFVSNTFLNLGRACDSI